MTEREKCLQVITPEQSFGKFGQFSYTRVPISFSSMNGMDWTAVYFNQGSTVLQGITLGDNFRESIHRHQQVRNVRPKTT